MLSLDTAYRSFGGEVEASSTPTICRLPDSRRHQLSAIAPQRRQDGNRLFSCRKAVLSKQGAHLGWDDRRRQDMDMRFLVGIPPLLLLPPLLTQRGSPMRFDGWPLSI